MGGQGKRWTGEKSRLAGKVDCSGKMCGRVTSKRVVWDTL